MKHLLSLFLLLLSLSTLQAQIPGLESSASPVEWKTKVEKQSDESFNLILEANIKEGWHMFSQHTPEGGSLPLELDFLEAGETYSLEGETKESPTKQQFNDVFGVDEIIWENKAVLTQEIKLKDSDVQFVKDELFYQVCEEVCINENYYIVFDLENSVYKVLSNYFEFEVFVNESKKITSTLYSDILDV